jgi:hypothetical protein
MINYKYINLKIFLITLAKSHFYYATKFNFT